MTLRKMLPAALLLLAACSTSTTATETDTSSVGMNPAAKSCCAKPTECTEEKKAACDAAKACPEGKTCDKAAATCPETGAKVNG